MEEPPIQSAKGPTRIGRYLVYGQFAKGGTATVHFGRLVGPAGFSRTVAIKRLRQTFASDPEFVRMLIDEARLTARISHQCVVSTLDVVVRDAVTYIVMEYTRGVPLSLLFARARARNASIDPCIVTSIVSSVLHGLHAAHEARDELGHPLGIVHRDVSPQNIVVGVDGTARVLDFGIAKAALVTQATRSGYVKGKFAYMAPEQLAGVEVDRRADVFASAVVLWELLTGERLFGGGSLTQAVTKLTNGGEDPPSTRAPHVATAFDEVTMRALARDKNLRFPTARAMALALEAAHPMAPASEISEWVSALAGDVLEAHQRQLREIESFAAAEASDTEVETKTEVWSLEQVSAALRSAGYPAEVANDPPEDTVADAPPNEEAEDAPASAESADGGEADEEGAEAEESEPEDAASEEPSAEESDHEESDESDESGQEDSDDDDAEGAEEDAADANADDDDDDDPEPRARPRVGRVLLLALGVCAITGGAALGIDAALGQRLRGVLGGGVAPVAVVANPVVANPVMANSVVANPAPSLPAPPSAQAAREPVLLTYAPAPTLTPAPHLEAQRVEAATKPPAIDRASAPRARPEQRTSRRTGGGKCVPPYELENGVKTYKVECL